jgi:hypothetical protein
VGWVGFEKQTQPTPGRVGTGFRGLTRGGKITGKVLVRAPPKLCQLCFPPRGWVVGWCGGFSAALKVYFYSS